MSWNVKTYLLSAAGLNNHVSLVAPNSVPRADPIQTANKFLSDCKIRMYKYDPSRDSNGPSSNQDEASAQEPVATYLPLSQLYGVPDAFDGVEVACVVGGRLVPRQNAFESASHTRHQHLDTYSSHQM